MLLQAFRLFVRNYSPYNASADIFVGGESLGKWLIAHEPKTWHSIACDSIFKFRNSYGTGLTSCLHATTGQKTDRQSKFFEPTTMEIRFQHLFKVQDSTKACLVPVIAHQPSPEDGPSYVPFVSPNFFIMHCLRAIVLMCPMQARRRRDAEQVRGHR
jgi:hypothetical protein